LSYRQRDHEIILAFRVHIKHVWIGYWKSLLPSMNGLF
jgi:hypothetical protein